MSTLKELTHIWSFYSETTIKRINA